MTTFTDLELDKWLVDALAAMSLTQPTAIQQACIKPTLAGRDIIGGAKTGSGKTLAFALPILQQLSQDPYGVFALVLTPTRELAYQIADQFNILGKTTLNLKVTIAIGGEDMMHQALELSKRPHIVVATPGRLADHIESSPKAIFFSKVKYLVLDEADRLLTDTFAPDLSVIVDALPDQKHRQTLLFTATMTNTILKLKDRQDNPPFVHLCEDEAQRTVEGLAQNYIFVPSHVKEAYLVHLLMSNVGQLEHRPYSKISIDQEASAERRDRSIIIFVGRCQAAESLRVMLHELGFRVTALHSKMPQKERLNSLGKFRARSTKILIATDVGSRGLDIPSVELVINMQVPRDADEYIHRVGRTARAGKTGRAITIMSERDIKLIHNIEARIGKQLEELPVSEKKVLDGMGKVLAAKRVAALHLLDIDFGAKDRARSEKKRATSSGKAVAKRPKIN